MKDISVEEYLSNPCGTLSIPFWKNKVVNPLEFIKIFHRDEFNNQYENYQRFFRIQHDLKNINMPLHEYHFIHVNGKMVASGIAQFDRRLFMVYM